MVKLALNETQRSSLTLLLALTSTETPDMIKRFNKLSLNKNNTFSKSSMDYEIPSNQEAMTKFVDLDLTINLGETSYVKHNLTEELNEIREILDKRLVLLKRKESLTYGARTGKFPPWFSAKFHCSLNLPNEENARFEDFWKILSEKSTKETVDSVLEFLDTQVRDKETEVNRVRTEALRKLKTSSGDFETEQKHLDDRILKINEQQTKEIHQFRSKLDALLESAVSQNPRRERRETEHRRPFPRRHYPQRGHPRRSRNQPY